MMTKQELRKELRERHEQHAPEESEAVVRRLLAHPHMQQAAVVALYYSLPDEVCTHQLADLLAATGKTVLLPRVTDDENMEWHRYTGSHDLRIGAFGIMEPVGERYTDYGSIELAVVPGMAFDREGHRLGRGRGYYDRFLSRVPNIYKIGVCFKSRLLDHVPTGTHDVAMDEVIS